MFIKLENNKKEIMPRYYPYGYKFVFADGEVESISNFGDNAPKVEVGEIITRNEKTYCVESVRKNLDDYALVYVYTLRELKTINKDNQ